MSVESLEHALTSQTEAICFLSFAALSEAGYAIEPSDSKSLTSLKFMRFRSDGTERGNGVDNAFFEEELELVAPVRIKPIRKDSQSDKYENAASDVVGTPNNLDQVRIVLEKNPLTGWFYAWSEEIDGNVFRFQTDFSERDQDEDRLLGIGQFCAAIKAYLSRDFIKKQKGGLTVMSAKKTGCVSRMTHDIISQPSLQALHGGEGVAELLAIRRLALGTLKHHPHRRERLAGVSALEALIKKYEAEEIAAKELLGAIGRKLRSMTTDKA